MLGKLIKFQFILATLTVIAATVQIQQVNGSPQFHKNVNVNVIPNNLDSIFKIGTGKLVFAASTTGSSHSNSKPIMNDVKNVICDEQGVGKLHCANVSINLLTKQLDQIHPQQFEKFATFFKDDYLPAKNMTSRLDGVDEESYCNSRTRIIHPKRGETRQSKWVLVVQHRQHRQGVLVEQCASENAHCKYNELLPLGIASKCKQHFVYRTMVVYVDGVLKEEMIKLPNYCDCVLYFNSKRRWRY